MKESDLSRNLQGTVKARSLMMCSLLVLKKTASFTAAGSQNRRSTRLQLCGPEAAELKRYLQQDILEPHTLARNFIERSLFDRC